MTNLHTCDRRFESVSARGLADQRRRRHLLLAGLFAFACDTPAQEVPSSLATQADSYVAAGRVIDVTVALDRLGVAPQDGVDRPALAALADRHGLHLLEAAAQPFFVLVVDAAKPVADPGADAAEPDPGAAKPDADAAKPDADPRRRVRHLARTLEQEEPELVRRAGLLVTPAGAELPLLLRHELLVRFRPKLDADAIAAVLARHPVAVVPRRGTGGELLLLDVLGDADTLAVCRALLAEVVDGQTALVWAEPHFVHPIEHHGIPDDPLFADQWHHENTGQGGGTTDADLDTPQAWDLTTGSDTLVIAVLDSGFQADHPDLVDNLWVNPGDPAVDGIDDDGNGLVDDVHGWDFWDDDATLEGSHHGTAVAGCAGARGDNGRGVSGTCPVCQLMLLSRDVTADGLDDKDAFEYAVAHGADVINCSWSYPASHPMPAVVREAIEAAVADGRGGLGCVVVFATRNVNTDVCQLGDLASLPQVLGVGSCNNRDEKILKSAIGSCLDVLGPTRRRDPNFAQGTLHVTTTDEIGSFAGYNAADLIPYDPVVPEEDRCHEPAATAALPDAADYTACFGGSSAAAPFVAGVAGLVLSVAPGLTWQEVQRLLADTADRIEDSQGDYDDRNGYSTKATHAAGRVNAFEAVRVVAPVALGGRGGVDVFVRDNRLDWGNTEQPSFVLFEPDRDTVPAFIGHWESLDVKIDGHPLEATPVGTAAAFEAQVHEQPVADRLNRVSVRVRNRGPHPATAVTVKAYWAFASTPLPPLPADFWSAFPGDSADTSAWHPLGVATIATLPPSGPSVAGLADDGAGVVTLPFVAPPLVPGQPSHTALLVVVDCAQDPVAAASRVELAPDVITPRDNNVTVLNIQLLPAPGDGWTTSLLVRNPLQEAARTRLLLQAPPGVLVSLPALPASGLLTLGPGQQQLLTLEGQGSGTGPITVMQLLETDDGQQELLGGITFVLPPPPTPEAAAAPATDR